MESGNITRPDVVVHRTVDQHIIIQHQSADRCLTRTKLAYT
jgi:hypothetical protein